MHHIDPEQLALMAMGESAASPDDTRHLDVCSECAAELAVLAHAVDVGRATIDVGELETPAPVVWSRISEELGLATATTDASADDRERGAGDAVGAADSESTSPASDTPVPTHQAARRPQRRSRARVIWALAAAVVLIAGVGLGGWVLGQRSTLVPVAQAALAPFPDHPTAQGTALVEQKRDGQQVVRVTLDAAGVPHTYREVWLITADATSLISLGVLDGTVGTFTIPEGVNLRDYVLVDVSQENLDGNPNHSGDSIVRGQLAFDSPAV